MPLLVLVLLVPHAHTRGEARSCLPTVGARGWLVGWLRRDSTCRAVTRLLGYARRVVRRFRRRAVQVGTPSMRAAAGCASGACEFWGVRRVSRRGVATRGTTSCPQARHVSGCQQTRGVARAARLTRDAAAATRHARGGARWVVLRCSVLQVRAYCVHEGASGRLRGGTGCEESAARLRRRRHRGRRAAARRKIAGTGAAPCSVAGGGNHATHGAGVPATVALSVPVCGVPVPVAAALRMNERPECRRRHCHSHGGDGGNLLARIGNESSCCCTGSLQ